jgi:hypothetical protein
VATVDERIPSHVSEVAADPTEDDIIKQIEELELELSAASGKQFRLESEVASPGGSNLGASLSEPLL